MCIATSAGTCTRTWFLHGVTMQMVSKKDDLFIFLPHSLGQLAQYFLTASRVAIASFCPSSIRSSSLVRTQLSPCFRDVQIKWSGWCVLGCNSLAERHCRAMIMKLHYIGWYIAAQFMYCMPSRLLLQYIQLSILMTYLKCGIIEKMRWQSQYSRVTAIVC